MRLFFKNRQKHIFDVKKSEDAKNRAKMQKKTNSRCVLNVNPDATLLDQINSKIN
jgi:hypothetical protein